MAEKVPTPLDPLTGNPLPLRLVEPLPANAPHIANQHHPWHPSDAVELDTSTLAGNALRNTAKQLVPVEHHNVKREKGMASTIHDFCAGPPLPQTDEEVFRLLVPAWAGYIPDEAIDVSQGELRVVRLTDKEKEILRMPSRVQGINPSQHARLYNEAIEAYESLINPSISREAYADQFIYDFFSRQIARNGYQLHHFTFGYSAIRDFFRHYVMTRDMGHVDEPTIEEFLCTKDEQRKRFLGHLLLGIAVEVATDEVRHTYAALRRRGNLPPMMPRSARTLVKQRLGKQKQQEALALSLGHRLRKEVGLAA